MKKVDAHNPGFQPALADEKPGVRPASASALNSWKEIAAYVGRGVRTVQRWERDLGLPVRRPHDHLRSPVIAIPAEIDAWLQRSKPRRGGKRAVLTRSEIFQNTQALNAKLKVMCERTQQLSETIRCTVACSKGKGKMPLASPKQMAS